MAQGHIADLSRYINRRDPDDQHYRYNFLEIMVKYNTKESLEVFNYLANNPKFSKDLDICSHTLRFRNFKGDSEAMMKVVHTNLIKKWDEKDQAFYAPKIEMMKKTLFRESIQNL